MVNFITPEQINALVQRAFAFQQQGDLQQAIASYQQVLRLQPKNFDALQLLGSIFAQLQDYPKAVDYLTAAIKVNSKYGGVHNNLGNVQRQLGQNEKAVASFNKAIALMPQLAEAHHNRGLALYDLKRYGEAVASYDQCLAVQPTSASALKDRGLALQKLARFEEAVASFDKAIVLLPRFAVAYFHRGNALYALGRVEDAIASFDQSITIGIDNPHAYFNRAVCLISFNKLNEALADLEQALKLDPRHVGAYSNRGYLLSKWQRHEEAVANYDQAIAIDPNHIPALKNKGNALYALRQCEQAVACFDQVIKLDPQHHEAYSDRGLALGELGREAEALASFDRAIAIHPKSHEAYNNRGNLLFKARRLEEALESFGHALAAKPDYPFLLGMYQHTKMCICHWGDFELQIERLMNGVNPQTSCTHPFPLLTLVDAPDLHKIAGTVFGEKNYPVDTILGDIPRRPAGPKIRIGYYSADFHEHATAYLMAEFFELHDKTKFEIVAFSFGPNQLDPMRERLINAFDQFIDVSTLSDQDVARLSRDKEIDIAVDLKGFTEGCRPGIFACRAAPIQVNYLGFPGSMGTPYFDYIVADTTLIPAGSEQYYSEKIVYLPHSYQVNDRKRSIAQTNDTRVDLGLPEQGFVFCCFNNNYKITPSTFDSWMRIMKQVDGSVLWLLGDNPAAVKRLTLEAEKRGVASNRLIFAARVPLAEHLARQRLADLFLDTLPCNAHTTASDALWAGLPVLTIAGRSFVSRVAASLLNAVGLPELVTTNEADYEALAIELATDSQRMSRLKEKLLQNRLTAPLFDTVQITQSVEAAYQTMMDRYHQGLLPDHIRVAG